ncbi:membrane protein [Microvirga vignae]|uniref:Membrane protein n=1 Tax=Microvirga vignae TaxID=1225564 RepID=A0A0H1RNA4_9HYPH|nr:membrane protein [Microvirga vignae]
MRPRFLGSTLLAILVYALLPEAWAANSRLLMAWDIGVVCYLALAWIMAAHSSTAKMQQRAAEEDETAVVFLILTLAAAVASLAAIAVELYGLHDTDNEQVFRLAIAGVTILCSWFFVHTIYAIHYAHEYYGDRGERQGLAFPHKDKPDYWDFLYFSFNLGAAGQTSDVAIVSKRMRRLALAHTILAFLFNTTILALAVNVGAGQL